MRMRGDGGSKVEKKEEKRWRKWGETERMS